MPKQIVARWDYLATQKEIERSLIQRPADHPGAFLFSFAAPELAFISQSSVGNEDFLAKVELAELGDMLERFAQEYAPFDQDRIEFARYDFENRINLELFRRVEEVPFYCTRANFGNPAAQITLIFSVCTAEQLLDRLGIAGSSRLELQRHDNGLWSLKADSQLFVIEDLEKKVEKDLSQMSDFEKQSLSCLIGVEIEELTERLIVWFKEVGYAPY